MEIVGGGAAKPAPALPGAVPLVLPERPSSTQVDDKTTLAKPAEAAGSQPQTAKADLEPKPAAAATTANNDLNENPVEAALANAEVFWRMAESTSKRLTLARAAEAKSPDSTEAKGQTVLALNKAESLWKKALAAAAQAESAKTGTDAVAPWDAELDAKVETARKKAESARRKAGLKVVPPVQPPPVAKAPVVPIAKAPAVPAAKAPVIPTVPAPVTVPPLQPKLEKRLALPTLARIRRKFSVLQLSFLLAVIVPVMLLALYYLFISSDQYRSEMRFAVRGTERSTLENLGLNALPGASTQAADAYIVIDYIHSTQVLIDIQQKLGIDVRQFFARPDIDFAYRIDPNMPLEKFINYWRWMVDASYNSTTSITTFEVTAFNGPDAAAIAQAVLKVSDELVNELSTKARLQLISNAQSEVTRTEERLIEARQAVSTFRDREQTANPTMLAESDQVILQGIEKTLIELKSRRASLLSTVDANSPSVRVLDRQIASYTAELEQKRRGIGSGGQGSGDSRTLTTQLAEYNALALEQEFSEKAYTTALASLETSQAEARRQDRYFAIAVEPNVPQIALYPLRLINTLIAFFVFCLAWLIGYLVVQAVRDHTV